MDESVDLVVNRECWGRPNGYQWALVIAFGVGVSGEIGALIYYDLYDCRRAYGHVNDGRRASAVESLKIRVQFPGLCSVI